MKYSSKIIRPVIYIIIIIFVVTSFGCSPTKMRKTSSQGLQALKKGQYYQAQKYFQDGLVIAKNNNDKGNIARLLFNVGLAQTKQKKFGDALRAYEQALAVFREIKEPHGEMRALWKMAFSLGNLGKFNKAREHYVQAKEVALKSGDYKSAKKLTKALNTFDNAKQKQLIATNDIRQNFVSKLKTMLQKNGETTPSSTGLKDIVDDITLGNPSSFIAGLGTLDDITLGNQYLQNTRNPQAFDALFDNLAIVQKQGDKKVIAETLLNIGREYGKIGRYGDALGYYGQAISVSRKDKNIHTEGEVLTAVGIAYRMIGLYDKALEYSQQALTVNQKIGSQINEKRALSNIGMVFDEFGQYNKALKYLRLAKEIKLKISDLRGESDILLNIGIVYRSLRQNTKALEFFGQAIDIKRKENDRYGEGVTLSNIGMVHLNAGKYREALKYFNQAQTIYRETQNLRGEGRTHLSIGDVYRNLGQNDKTLEHYRQALEFTRELDDSHGEGVARVNLGDIYSNQNQYSKALEYYEQSLTLFSRLGTPDSVWRAWSGISKSLVKLNKPHAAIFTGKQAVNVLQSIRSVNSKLEAWQQKELLIDKKIVYQQLADLLIDQGRLLEAQQILGMLKEEEYFDFIRRTAKNDPRMTQVHFNAFEAEQIGKIEKVSQQFQSFNTAVELGLNNATRTQGEEERLKSVYKKMIMTSMQFRAVLHSTKNAFEKRAEVHSHVSAGTLDDLDKRSFLKKLGSDVALVNYLVLKDNLHILLTTGDGISAHKVDITQATLNHSVQSLRTALLNPETDPRTAAQALYQSLITPIDAELKKAGIRTLMVSATGGIRYIPIGALYDGEHYLAERLAVVSYTAAASDDNLGLKPQAELGMVGFGVSQAHSGFSELPAVRGELEGIIRHSDNDPDGVVKGKIYLDEAFTAQTLEIGLKTKQPLLHVASHFQFNPGTDADSFLLLGDGSHLTLRELREGNYSFDAIDLITLSACETAIEIKDLEGQEVEGLATLAQRKGAKAVLATLWSVADASTGVFMQRFYQLREEKGVTKGEALRLAQIEFLNGGNAHTLGVAMSARGFMLDDASSESSTSLAFKTDPERPYRHPYYWAPFILMGNWL